MNIGGLDVQPILLYLPDTPQWLERWQKAKEHLESAGFYGIIHVPGIYGRGFGIDGTHLYEYDNPGGGHKIGVDNTAGFLSMYMIYNIMNNLPNKYFLFLEDDSRFEQGWIKKVEKATAQIPDNFDWLFLGSCCTEGKGAKKVGENLYHFPHREGTYANYPLCGNAYIVAKKALPHVIATQRDAYVNADINLAVNTFPQLNIYAILPRIVEQFHLHTGEINPLPA